jgi:hypothetical protein
MSRRDINVPLWDVIDAGERILRYTAGKSAVATKQTRSCEWR